MEYFYKFIGAFGVSLALSSYVCLTLRTFRSKKLFIETLLITFAVSGGAFFYFDIEESFLFTMGVGGLLLSFGLLSARRLVSFFENRYEEERIRRGEKTPEPEL